MKKIKKILLVFFTVLLTACSLPGISSSVENDVIVASGTYTERQVLAEIVTQMVEHNTDLKVTQIKNLGSTTMTHIAMEKKSLNVVGGMYTGTSLTGECGMEPERDPEKAMELVRESYLKKFDRIWFPSYGFDNTYAFMATKEFAEAHNLTKVSQLKDIAGDIKVGVDSSWVDRPGDGYEAFKATYGFEFPNFYSMDIGLVYSALSSGNMDVVLGYSTDGRINSYNLVLLEDDLQLFPAYDCSPAASVEILKKHPELIEILLKLKDTISSEKMQELNKLASEDRIEPNIVAKEFLEANHYFDDVKVDQKELERIRGEVNAK